MIQFYKVVYPIWEKVQSSSRRWAPNPKQY
jgi:hypothetical protein